MEDWLINELINSYVTVGGRSLAGSVHPLPQKILGATKAIFIAGEAVVAGERFLVINRTLETSSLGKCPLAPAFDSDLSHVAPGTWSPCSIKTLGAGFLLMHKSALELEYQLSFVV